MNQSGYCNPSVDDFKAYFVRDFPYGDTLDFVLDADIYRAICDAQMQINPEFADCQGDYTQLFLLLAAHNLCVNLRASSQGLAGKYQFLDQSAGVGGMNYSQAIPPRILEQPYFAMISKTEYGAKYLMLVLPNFSGVMASVGGRTKG